MPAMTLELNKIHCMDCLEGLRQMDENSVDCCITSPPYWGLRDYGTATWEGGNPECDHIEKEQLKQGNSGGLSNCQLERGKQPSTKSSTIQYKEVCGKCGAKRIDRQIGLEKTPEEYVAHMVEVFREVRRVLRKDGTLWLNLGDSYYNYRPGAGQSLCKQTIANTNQDHPTNCPRRANVIDGLKEKDLVGIPWRVAFALQADGWYLRQDIIWAKPNPMPESVTDRCTKSHEYIFLLTKSKKYYFDAEGIKEKAVEYGKDKRSGKGNIRYEGKRTMGDQKSNGQDAFVTINETRNKRSVWTVNTKPFKEAHFATFPPELIEPMILAGCPKGGVVLDPFIGAGTTAVMARYLSRQFVGFDLNFTYVEMAEKRVKPVMEQQQLSGWTGGGY